MPLPPKLSGRSSRIVTDPGLVLGDIVHPIRTDPALIRNGTCSGAPLGRNSRPPFLKGPRLLFVSTEVQELHRPVQVLKLALPSTAALASYSKTMRWPDLVRFNVDAPSCRSSQVSAAGPSARVISSYFQDGFRPFAALRPELAHSRMPRRIVPRPLPGHHARPPTPQLPSPQPRGQSLGNEESSFLTL